MRPMTLAEKLTNVRRMNANKAALVAGAILFVLLLAIYTASPIRTSADSRWSIPTAMSFIRGHGGELSAYMPPSPDYAPSNYAITTIDGRTYSIYPIGAPLLAIPAVALAAWTEPAFATSIVKTTPEELEKAIASFYGAAACALFFWLIFARFNDLRIAIATTLIFGLGTSMWSTSTRALWQHGPLVLMFIGAMLLLLGALRRPTLAQYVSIPLALSFITRPTAGIAIALISAYVLIYYRSQFLRFMLWAAVIAGPWLIYNMVIWNA